MAKFIINVSKIKGRLEVKISQNIWSNLKKVEIYLISKIMKYKIDPIDLKHLLGKGFTKQNRPNRHKTFIRKTFYKQNRPDIIYIINK